MIEQSVSLASNGVAKVPGYEQLVRFGYTKNRGVYRLHVDATGEWEGLTIRAFWHVPGGSDPASSLVVDSSVDVPASVTAQPGSGCITFEGSDGTKTVTSADLRYRVSANSGTDDGSMPEPGTPAWQQLVGAVHTDAIAAEQAKTDAQTAAQQAGASAQKAWQALSDTITAKEDALKSIGDKQTTATQAVDTARDKALQQVEASTKAAKTAASEAATSAGSADQSAQEAAGSLQELKDGIASGDFKGEPGNDGKSPVVTVTDIENGHRVSITDKDGTKTIDVLNGQAGKDGTQIDDATVGLDAWSSKHIVDMLCPPLEETGNPVVCYPVVGSKLGVKASWEPAQEGSGEPSPDNVRPIKGRDSVTVTRCGKNCFDFGRISRMEQYTADYEKKTITVPAYTNNAGYIDTLSALCPGIIPGIWIISAKVSNPTAQKLIYILDTKKAIKFGKPYTLTSDDLSSAFAWYNGPDQPVQNVISDIQVTYGTASPTTYTPYTGQTATLSLPRTIYGGEVDAVTGEGQETWNLLTLDGTEDWKARNTVDTTKHRFYIKILDRTSVSSTMLSADIVSDRYKTIPANLTYRNVNGISADPGNSKIVDIYDDDYSERTLDEWKSYLAAQYAAGTPVQIAYKLAKPAPFTATGAQPIPALSGTNTVITDVDSVTVTGRADPIKRIIDLEDAVASMTNT